MPETKEVIRNEEQMAIENVFPNPPNWITYWGITVIFLILIASLILAGLLKYPDQLQMSGVLTTINPPIEVLAKETAQIDSLYVSDKSNVAAQDIVLTLKSVTKKASVDFLKSYISTLDSNNNIVYIKRNRVPEIADLGDLTTNFVQLTQSIVSLKNYMAQKNYYYKIKSLEKEINYTIRLNRSFEKQLQLNDKDYVLTGKDYARNESLWKNGVISSVDKEKSEQKYLQESKQLESFKMNLINNNIRIQQLKSQQSDIKMERDNEIIKLHTDINKNIDNIKFDISKWEDLFIIKTPISGKLSFKEFLTNNQIVTAAKPVFSVIPSDSQELYIIRGKLPIKSSGTLALGQKAIVTLVNYPSNIYGTLTGIVDDISSIPSEDKYSVTLKLPNQLNTNYKKTIPKQQNLTVDVQIKTKEYSLLDRLFQNFMGAIKNRN
jgi:HlyD family secretion protein